MGLNSYVGTFTADTTKTAGQTQAITGLGFQPKLVIFWMSGQTSGTDAITQQDISLSFGAATGSGTLNKSVGFWSDDGVGTSDTCSSARSQRAVNCVTSNTTADQMELTSLDSDGFTMTIRDQFASAVQISYLALGGTDITNVKVGSWTTGSTTGNESVTDPGFQPDAVILFTHWVNSADGITSQASVSIGAIDGTNQWVMSMESRDGQGSSDTARYCRTDECLARVYNNTIPKRASFVSLDTNGFTLNWVENTVAHIVFYIAIQGCGVTVGNLLTQTDTATAITESGFGYAPSAAMFISAMAAESTLDTSAAHAGYSIGSAVSTSSRVTQAVFDEDGNPNMIECNAIEYDAVYAAISTTQAIEGLMDMQSFDSGGFTCIMDDADPSQKLVGYIAFGPTPVTPSGNPWYVYAQQ